MGSVKNLVLGCQVIASDAERRRFIGALKVLILSLILAKGRVHGYEVYKTIEVLGGGRWRPSLGTIYRVLNEMVEEGFIEKHGSLEGRRYVAYYTATPRGAEFFADTAAAYLRRVRLVIELILRASEKLRDLGVEPTEIEELAEGLRNTIEGLLARRRSANA